VKSTSAILRSFPTRNTDRQQYWKHINLCSLCFYNALMGSEYLWHVITHLFRCYSSSFRMGILYYTPAPYCVPVLFSILMMCQNKITSTDRKPLWILQLAFHPLVQSTDYTYICTCMCIKLQLILLCELYSELIETCNQGGYTPSIMAGQGGCRRKIRTKERRN
jgi:hypothetical protein